MNSFYKKYLKYKKKYSKIKKQVGGTRDEIVNVNGKDITISFPERFFCQITEELFVDPVTTEDGITIERKTIEDWFITHNTSPVTGAPIGNLLIPNHAIRNSIEELKQDAYQRLLREEIGDLSQRADAGDPNAQYELALKYNSGTDLVDRDVKKAIDLLQKASSVGHPNAKSLLESIVPSSRARDTFSSSGAFSSSGMAAVGSVRLSFPVYNLPELVRHVREIMELTNKCITNPEFKKGPDMTMAARFLRNTFADIVGPSIPSIGMTNLIVKHVGENRVLSLAAGKAAQETCLAAKGVQIVCTDLDPPRDSWMPVERLSNDEAVAKWRSQCEIAMCVWPDYISRDYGEPGEPRPPFPDCHTYLALLAGNFQKIIYIGEEDGCTGSEQLESFLTKNYRQVLREVDGVYGPTWKGIHDFLRIFERITDKVVAVPKPDDD